jgi:hypothetical protein
MMEEWQAILQEKQRAAAVERRRRAKQLLLAHLETEYAATQNPMAIWGAWQLCRGDGDGFVVPLPPWVIAYFDNFAVRLQDWVEKGVPSDRLSEEVGNALGFKARGKSQNPITDWRNRLEGEAWYARFEHHVRAGSSPTAAIKRTAEDVHNTEATVRRRLDDFAQGFGVAPLELVRRRTQLREADEAALAESERRTAARLAAILRGEQIPDEADDLS